MVCAQLVWGQRRTKKAHHDAKPILFVSWRELVRLCPSRTAFPSSFAPITSAKTIGVLSSANTQYPLLHRDEHSVENTALLPLLGSSSLELRKHRTDLSKWGTPYHQRAFTWEIFPVTVRRPDLADAEFFSTTLYNCQWHALVPCIPRRFNTGLDMSENPGGAQPGCDWPFCCVPT